MVAVALGESRLIANLRPPIYCALRPTNNLRVLLFYSLHQFYIDRAFYFRIQCVIFTPRIYVYSDIEVAFVLVERYF